MNRPFIVLAMVLVFPALVSCSSGNVPAPAMPTASPLPPDISQSASTQASTPAAKPTPAPTPTPAPDSGISRILDDVPCSLQNLRVFDFTADQKNVTAFGVQFIGDDGVSTVYCDFFTGKELFHQSSSSSPIVPSKEMSTVYGEKSITFGGSSAIDAYMQANSIQADIGSIKTFKDLREMYEKAVPANEWLIMPWADLVTTQESGFSTAADELPVNTSEIHVLEFRPVGSNEKPKIAITLECGSDDKNYPICFGDPFSEKTIAYLDDKKWILVGTEYLPGNYEMIQNSDMAGYFQYRANSITSRINLAGAAIGTYKDLREFYLKMVPPAQQYIPPLNMRGIHSSTYVEFLTVGGEEKIMFVNHYDENFSVLIAATNKESQVKRYYSDDVISGECVYFMDYLDSVLQPPAILSGKVTSLRIQPKNPPKLVLFSKYFKGVPYNKFMTVDELIAFYKANIPAEKQILIPLN